MSRAADTIAEFVNCDGVLRSAKADAARNVVVITSPERRAVRPGDVDSTRKLRAGINARELARWANPDERP